MSNCVLKDCAAWRLALTPILKALREGTAGGSCGWRTARFEHRELLKGVRDIVEYQRGKGYFQMG